jgi:hypothetical protein
MNGDGRDDVVANWLGSGVWFWDSISGVWVKLSSPALQITAGDIDADGTDDLVGVWNSGLWVKYSSTMSWVRFATSLPVDIGAGLFGGGAWGAGGN